MDFKPYIELVKFRYHPSFILILLPALLWNQFNLPVIKNLFVLYIFFNIFFYTGIYTFNDIKDVASDRKHPKKRERPIASGKISIQHAYQFALLCLIIGFIGAYAFFGPLIIAFFCGFLLLNILYTLWLKKIPYFELLGNTLTHALRITMGFAIAGVAPHVPLIGFVFLLALIIATLRRIAEKQKEGWEARTVLRAYGKKELPTVIGFCFLGLLIITIIDHTILFFYVAILIALTIFLLGFYRKTRPHQYLQKIWLN